MWLKSCVVKGDRRHGVTQFCLDAKVQVSDVSCSSPYLRRIFKDQTSHTKGSAWTAWTYFRPFLNCLCSRSGWPCRGAENEQNMFKKRPGDQVPMCRDRWSRRSRSTDTARWWCFWRKIWRMQYSCSCRATYGNLQPTLRSSWNTARCALLDEIFRAGRTPWAQLLSSSPLSELGHSALVLELTDCTATCEAWLECRWRSIFFNNMSISSLIFAHIQRR